MRGSPQFGTALAVLACLGAMTCGANAISATAAKRCEALTIKAFPPRQPGNPARGIAKGTVPEEQAFYRDCVAREEKSGPQRDEHGPISAEPKPHAGIVIRETDHSPYRPCPANVAMNGRHVCLGGPWGAYPSGVKVRRHERSTYRPCPASVAIHGRNLCLG
jgi:hypothetical protein